MKLAEGVQTDQSFSNFTNENDDYATLIEMVSQAKKCIYKRASGNTKT